MNNKQLGTAFEREFCDMLKQAGFWVHFCNPSAAGAQPCDVIAVRNREAYLIDCKTSARATFKKDRLETNQICAFERWRECGNVNRYVAVKHKDNVYMIPVAYLFNHGIVELTDKFLYSKWSEEL